MVLHALAGAIGAAIGRPRPMFVYPGALLIGAALENDEKGDSARASSPSRLWLCPWLAGRNRLVACELVGIDDALGIKRIKHRLGVELFDIHFRYGFDIAQNRRTSALRWALADHL